MTKFIYDYYSLEFLLTFLYEQSFTYFDEVATSIFFCLRSSNRLLNGTFLVLQLAAIAGGT